MRVAIYSRVSTAGQKEEGFSLQDQERRLRMFCQQKGYEVIDHYSDDLSGKYKRADTDLKQRMIGSIFSEKLCFDGKKYRTVPLNPAIELMVSNIKPFNKAQKKQASKKRDLSRTAPPLGLEPRTL